MDIIDRKIKKYKDVLTTLKENKRHRAKDDDYNYDVDIMDTKWFINDLEAIKKARDGKLVEACLDEALPIPVVVQQSELLSGFRKWQKENWNDIYLMSDEFMIETYKATL